MGTLHELPRDAARSVGVLLRQHVRGEDPDPPQTPSVRPVRQFADFGCVGGGGHQDGGWGVVVEGHLDGLGPECCGAHGCCPFCLCLHLVTAHAFGAERSTVIRLMLEAGLQVLIYPVLIGSRRCLVGQAVLPLL